MSPRLLITGFGPFPGVPDNPSAELARRVAARLGVEAHVFDTRFAAVEAWHPPEGLQLVVHLGVAASAARFRVERTATDAIEDRADDAGVRRAAPPTRARQTPVDVEVMVAAAEAAGLPVELSEDAGRYLCNFTYFRSLLAGAPALFIHVPPAPEGLAGHVEVVTRLVAWAVEQTGA